MQSMVKRHFQPRLLKVEEGINQLTEKGLLTEVQKRDLNVNQKKTDISKYTIEEFKILEEKIQELLNVHNLEEEDGV